MKLKSFSTRVGALRSMEIQTLMEKPCEMLEDGSSQQYDELPQNELSNGGSSATSQVVILPSSNHSSPCKENGRHQYMWKYHTRKSVLLAKQPQYSVQEDVQNVASQEVETSSNYKIQVSMEMAKSKEKHAKQPNAKCDDSLNTKVVTSLKRKLRSSQPPCHKIISGDDMASWLQGTQFENLCIANNGIESEVVARKTIIDIQSLFQFLSTKLLKEQEVRPKCLDLGGRADLMTLKFIKNRFKCLAKSKKVLGAVPGVEIGDAFHYRAELLVVGLHCNLQAGIGCIKHGEKVVAASVVSSGGYNNAMDSSDILIYSGSGGHPGYKTKKEDHSSDQRLEGGNLALKNSIEASTPVRVIYGLKEDECSNSYAAKPKKIAAYVYDGLYLVEKYWSESGGNGFSTFKFQLRRMPGQREIGFKELAKHQLSEARRGVCIDDISCGAERIPILVVNTIDRELPMPFKYVTRMIYPPQHKLAPPRGCDCKDGCSDSVKCACVGTNGDEIPFNREGSILVAKPLVYECGPSCKCPPSCQNRVSQHGIKFRLEVFKTKAMGWGVRSPNKIPSGSFICEYVGEMLEDAEADKRENDEYLFDIGNNYNDESLWEGLPYVPSLQKRKRAGDMVQEYTIDAAKFANVGRFINHGCTPNLYAQNILYDHDEQGMPHVMLFASEDIPPFAELTYHYNYYIDRVQGPDGTIKKKDCYCGSFECTGRLY